MHLTNVFARYGRRKDWVLRGVDVSLATGDMVVLTGGNGSGKSTLLRVLAGLLPIGKGALADRPTSVAWVPERFPSDQPFTVWSYLERMAMIRGSSTTRITAVAERLSLDSFFGVEIGELSKGTARKVALTQALTAPPGLLIADEPWDGLDAQSQDALPGLLEEVTMAGGICVVTDHQAHGAELGAARAWRMSDGHVEEQSASGGPEDPAGPEDLAGPGDPGAMEGPEVLDGGN